jgi:hypothetical protein
VAVAGADGLLSGVGATSAWSPEQLSISGPAWLTRPLGPLEVQIAAPHELVFDVIIAPYADRETKALREKVRVLERGSDMVLVRSLST